ncbi:MAG: c-type cytochrome domain-containing protein [Verrucomicrobiota bacterium]
MEPPITFLLYLPLTLVFAAAVLEFAGAWQRSNRHDASSSILLWSAFVSLIGAVVVALFVKPPALESIHHPFASPAITGAVGALLLISLGLKSYCRGQGIGPKPKKGRRNAKLKGKALQQQLILGSFRGLLALTCVATGLALFQGGGILTGSPAPIIAESGDSPTPSPGDIVEPDLPAEPLAAPEPPIVAKVEATPDTPPAELASNNSGESPVAVSESAMPETFNETMAPDPVVAANGTVENPFKESPFADVQPAPPGESMLVSNAPRGPEPVEPASIEPEPSAPPTTASTGGTFPVKDPSGELYKKIISALFTNRCNDCHGPEKQKGGLRLDTPEWIRKGGDSGPVLVAGNPDRSYIYEVVMLPEDDPDIMPPKGKPLTDPQQRYIKQWILDGGSLGDGKEWPAEGGSAVAGGGAFEEDKMADGVGVPDSQLIEELKNEGVIIKPVSSNGALLEIDYSHAGRSAGDMRLEELAQLANNIHSLDLKKTKISDDDLAVVQQMSNLRKINLALTDIGDNGFKNIRGLQQVEYLNLYGTRVSDTSVSDLSEMTTLTKLFLWNSRVTESGYNKLKKALPSADISFGL